MCKVNINAKIVLIILSALCSIYVCFNIKTSSKLEYQRLEDKRLKLYCVIEEDMSANLKSYKIRVLKKKGYLKLNILDSKKNFEIGDIIFLSNVIVNAHDKYSNYDNFLRTGYYKSKQIYGIINVKEKNIKVLGKSKNTWYAVKNVAFKIRKNLEYGFSNIPRSEQEIIKGIVFGDENLEYSEKQKFSNLGIIHIMAVSGFNLGIIYIFLSTILNNLNRYLKIDYKFKNLIIMLSIWVFALITGFSDSIVRASLMMSVFLISGMLGFNYTTIYSLWMSVLIILFLSPFSIYSLGLYLSAGSVLGLIIFFKRLELLNKYIAGTIAAQILILPILIMSFNQVSYISILTNLFAVPLSSTITITGLVTSIIGIFSVKFANFLNGINYFLAKLLLDIVDFLDGLVKGKVDIRDLNFLEIFYYYLFLAIAFIKSLKYRKEILAGSLAIFLLIDSFVYLRNTDVTICFIDVGQGDSIFIKTKKGRNILIDGGGIPKWQQKNNFDVGERVVEPFLKSKDCKSLDLLVATHCHEDHIGGLYAVVRDYNVKTVMLSKYMNENDGYEKLINLIKSKKINIVYPLAGDKFDIDGLNFSVLNPQRNIKFIDTHSDDNNNSIVLKMNYKKFNVLFTGDIENEAEQVIDKQFAKELDCDILKSAHHGSRFSTSKNFLNLVSPNASIISVGYHNSFGHPSNSTLKRINESKSEIYRTDRDGCVIIYTDGYSQKVEALK